MAEISRTARRTVRKAAFKVLDLTRDRSHPGHEGNKVRGSTVAEGWDDYARKRLSRKNVGDSWNDPRAIGMDVDRPEDVVPYLDRNVIEPFFDFRDVILEIGPGGGRFTEVLLPKCKRLIAIDTSSNMLQLLRQRLGGDERLELRLGDGQGLGGVADASVDAAFSYGVFVHLQHWDIFNYLRELHRVLKPGGKALIQHSNSLSELGWKRFLFDTQRQLNQHKRPSSFTFNTPDLMHELIARAELEFLGADTATAKRDCLAQMRKPA